MVRSVSVILATSPLTCARKLVTLSIEAIGITDCSYALLTASVMLWIGLRPPRYGIGVAVLLLSADVGHSFFDSLPLSFIVSSWIVSPVIGAFCNLDLGLLWGRFGRVGSLRQGQVNWQFQK